MARTRSSSDGYFDLFYRDGWAYLAVHPPGKRGAPVYQDDIRNRMKLLGVPHVDPARIREIAEAASGVPVKLVRWPEGERLASRITVSISEDEMSAAVTVTAPKKGAAPPTQQAIRNALANAGINFGIDDEAITELLRNRRYDERVTAALGKDPVDAESAHIEYYFNPNRGKPYLELDFGRIDLRELNFIENRYEGDVLATLIPPVSPEHGRTVTNVPVSARTETKDVSLAPGENTVLSDDGGTLYAAADGNVKLSDGRVMVEPVVQVERVDYETGNIHFDGSVVVDKYIADRFVVEAGGDVQVGEGVGRATVRAGGHVLFKRGVSGGGAGLVECEGNLFAKFVENSTVVCKSHVFIEEAIMHSRLSAWKHCVLNGRRAEIIGSTVTVGGTLWCKKLGSVAEAPVHVAVGILPDFLSDYRKLEAYLADREDRLAAVQEKLQQIEHAIEEGHTAQKLRRAREQLAGEATGIAQELKELRGRYRDMRERLEARRSSLVVVEDEVYKGAAVSFGNVEYRAPDRGTRQTIFRFNGRSIEELGYNAAEAPTLEFESADEPRDNEDRPEASTDQSSAPRSES